MCFFTRNREEEVKEDDQLITTSYYKKKRHLSSHLTKLQEGPCRDSGTGNNASSRVIPINACSEQFTETGSSSLALVWSRGKGRGACLVWYRQGFFTDALTLSV